MKKALNLLELAKAYNQNEKNKSDCNFENASIHPQ